MAQRGEGVASNTSTYDMSVPRTVPSLAGMSASTQLSHSINTDLASEVGVHHILHEDENENLIAPTVERPFVSHCLFRIIGCRKTFDDAEEWKTHVTSHFKLQPVPLSVACQICKKTFQDAAEGEAWSQMLNHIATQHILQGETLVGTNPNYELMHYLYCKGIVTHVELSFLQFEDPDLETGAEHEGGAGSANEPYFVSVSSRRERRMKGRQI
ncbi:hypothetical protein PRK78_002509 [Emydomyces testavorans]|uniref:Uncharacterized protein n=1 Tax=Emydomyces testavorans TaxID=2070801 RepID=A0AAF0DFW4_9EURO|nr:hypothetical protein PRK78_002509 [Emydomyces testavorans]